MLEFGSCTAAVAAVCAVKPGDSLRLAVPALLFVLQNAADLLALQNAFSCEASQVTAAELESKFCKLHKVSAFDTSLLCHNLDQSTTSLYYMHHIYICICIYICIYKYIYIYTCILHIYISIMYTIQRHIWPRPATPPPPTSWSWSCMYAVCRRLYVRYSLHTPPPVGRVGCYRGTM